VGPPQRRHPVHRQHQAAPAGRPVLSARHDQGGIRSRRPGGQEIQLHPAPPRRRGKLITVPYHVEYKAELERTAALLREAAELSGDKSFADYLRMRADALLSDDFRPSDMAWMEMKTNPVDIVIGPIETYEDQLFGYKAAYEGLVLVKDAEWSKKLARYAGFLPELQKGLPVEARYKAEKPGSKADLNAYEAVYYAGDANVGAKTIAINLPNDEEVQLAKGTRRLQLENVMKAKFDAILVPIAKQLIARGPVAARDLRCVLRGHDVP
jgi:hypothetical protein